MSVLETYLLSKQRLTELCTDALFVELTGHLPVAGYFPHGVPATPKFAETFYVKIYEEDESNGIDDTNTIQYFVSLEDEKPFLIMGESDTGYTMTLGLFRAVGTRV